MVSNINRVPGVYVLRNNTNGKEYVGSTSNLFRRYLEHFNRLSRNRHCNNYLQNAYNKDPEAFEFITIKECSSSGEALEYEQDYLDVHDMITNGYNLRDKVI